MRCGILDGAKQGFNKGYYYLQMMIPWLGFRVRYSTHDGAIRPLPGTNMFSGAVNAETYRRYEHFLTQ